MTIIDTPVNNGVNTEALLGAREALSGAPEAAEFTWLANCSWVDGTYSQTTVDGFSGLGQEHHHRRPTRSTPTTPSASRPKIAARHRPRSCWQRWPAA